MEHLPDHNVMISLHGRLIWLRELLADRRWHMGPHKALRARLSLSLDLTMERGPSWRVNGWWRVPIGPG